MSSSIKASKPLKSIVGLSSKEIWNHLESLNTPEKHLFRQPYRAKIVYDWIMQKPGVSILECPNLRKDQRDAVEPFLKLPRKLNMMKSEDNTIKYLVETSVGPVETVYIPEYDRHTLCISSQVGCSLDCTFCHTGRQKLVGNLTSQDIVSQVLFANHQLGHPVNRILFMGQGEPLLNFRNVSESISMLKRIVEPGNIVVSTSGVAQNIPKLADLGVRLAVSLHAADDDLRREIMPAASKLSTISEIMGATKEFVNLTPTRKTRKVTFEWIMIEGVTDTLEQANKLIALVAGIPSKINLIHFNPWPGSTLQPSHSREFVQKLQRSLTGHVVTWRRPRGKDILAACGQLNTQSPLVSAGGAVTASP